MNHRVANDEIAGNTQPEESLAAADDLRVGLARKIVAELPKFGQWANSFRDFETPFGKIGYRQLSILWALRFDLLPTHVSPSELARLFGIRPSVMTRSLAKLDSAGFIVRQRDGQDARRIQLAITDKGRQVSEFVEGLYIREVLASMECLSNQQVKELASQVDLLGRIADRLGRGRFDDNHEAHAHDDV